MSAELLPETLEKAKGNATDIFIQLYHDYMEAQESDQAAHALQVILEYPYTIGDKEDEDPSEIDKKKEFQLYSLFDGIVRGTAKRIAEMNLTQDEYYQKIYQVIFDSSDGLFPQTPEERGIALKILSERSLIFPYFQIQPMEEISWEEFRKRSEQLRPKFLEAFHMMHRSIATKTGEAAQIWRIEHNLSEEKDQIVFLTMIFNYLRNNKKK